MSKDLKDMNIQQRRKIVEPKVDRITSIVCRLICLLFIVAFLVPIIYVLISSVYYRGTWSLEGYKILLGNRMVLTGLKNSIIIAGIGAVYSLILEIPAAYVLADKRHKLLNKVFFAFSQVGAAILPLYLLLKQLNLTNTIWALILPCGLSVYYTYLLRARMINIAGELEDAASIDGASTLVYILRIQLPILGPTVGCIGFFHICSYWSSTLYAQTFLTDEALYPLSVVLLELLIKNRSADVFVNGTSASSIGALQMAEFALCVISAIPLIGIFMMIKKNIRSMELDGGIVM